MSYIAAVLLSIILSYPYLPPQSLRWGHGHLKVVIIQTCGSVFPLTHADSLFRVRPGAIALPSPTTHTLMQ